MEQAEKYEVVQKLNAGSEALHAAVADVGEDEAVRRPKAGGWFILDCVEHVVMTERYLLTRLQAATVAEQPFEKWRREAKIAALAADRTRRIEAPEKVHPHQHFKTLAEALAAFDATRSEVRRWVEDCGDDLRCMMTDHALIEGPVTCAEMLIMIAAHPGRHARQIIEGRDRLS